MRKYFSLLLLTILCLGACSSKHKAHKATERLFTTDIHDNGSKRFVLAIVYQRTRSENAQGQGKRSGKKGGNKGGDRDGNKGGDRGKGQERSGSNRQQSGARENSDAIAGEEKRKEVMALLSEKLDETGYCRHGFIELNYLEMQDRTELIGECQESASEADRQRWG